MGPSAVVATSIDRNGDLTPSMPSQLSKRKRNHDEQGRSKRLMGLLNSTLTKFKDDQYSSANQQAAQKRNEIEKRLREKLQKEKEELDEQSRQKDEQFIKERISHANATKDKEMNLHSKFLRTLTQPTIFYLPNKLTTEQQSQLQ